MDVAMPMVIARAGDLGLSGLETAEILDANTALFERMEAIRCKADDTPRALLPFAQDGCGSSVFLDLTPEGRGSVLAFVRGLPSWTGLRSDSVWLPLAESFDAYVSMLRLDREAALEVLREDVRQQSHIEATEAWLDIGVPGWRDSDPGLVQAVGMARSRVAGS